MVKRANRRLFALRSLRRYGVPASDIILVHKSLVRSLLENAYVVFSNLPLYLSDSIEEVQRRALQINLPMLSYTEALTVSNLQSLKDRRIMACM